MSDEFMSNNDMTNQENSQPENPVPQMDYSEQQGAVPQRDYSQPQRAYQNPYSQGNYSKPDYSQTSYTQPNYTQTNYTQPNYSQQQYTQQNPYQQQTYTQQNSYQNPYQQQTYTQQNSYQQPYYGQAANQKGDGIGFGIASMIIGIASIFLFACCINYILAILAIISGIIQIVKNQKKGMAIAGIITAAISIILGTFFWIGIAALSEGTTDGDSFDEYLEEYLDGDEL